MLNLLLTYSQKTSRKGQKAAEVEIDAPKFLNYDMKNKQLKESSIYSRDAYIDNLVRIFSTKQKHDDMKEKMEQMKNQLWLRNASTHPSIYIYIF